jgi:hypothetical protein
MEPLRAERMAEQKVNLKVMTVVECLVDKKEASRVDL